MFMPQVRSSMLTTLIVKVHCKPCCILLVVPILCLPMFTIMNFNQPKQNHNASKQLIPFLIQCPPTLGPLYLCLLIVSNYMCNLFTYCMILNIFVLFLNYC